MVVRGRLAFDDQGRLVEIAEDAADPNNPTSSEIHPVEFDELVAQAITSGLVTTELFGTRFPSGNNLDRETILEDATGDLNDLTYDTGQVSEYDFLLFSYWAVPNSTSNLFMRMRLNGHSNANYNTQFAGGGETTGATSFGVPGSNSGTPFGGTYLITTTKYADRLPDTPSARHASVSLLSAAYPPTEVDPMEYGRLLSDVGVVTRVELFNGNNNGGSAFVQLEGVNLPQ